MNCSGRITCLVQIHSHNCGGVWVTERRLKGHCRTCTPGHLTGRWRGRAPPPQLCGPARRQGDRLHVRRGWEQVKKGTTPHTTPEWARHRTTGELVHTSINVADRYSCSSAGPTAEANHQLGASWVSQCRSPSHPAENNNSDSPSVGEVSRRGREARDLVCTGIPIL